MIILRKLRGAAALSAALALTLPLGWGGEPAAAEEAERLAPPVFDLDAAAKGGAPEAAEAAGWTRRTQLVWNDAKRDLERRAYEAWRSAAEAGLVFHWTPTDPAADRPGRVTGRGLMIWRRAGAASYDADAVVATYQGEMRDGRRNGAGVYRHASGFSYDGAWRDGRMDGQGALAFANGDHYVGGFAAGRLHGEGRYVDAEGVVYEGAFRDGRPEGEGLVRRPDDLIYRAVWKGGAEAPGTRRVLAEAQTLNAALDDEFRIGVVVESPPVTGSDDWGAHPADVAAYRSEANGETLVVTPASSRIMGVWRGEAPIHLLDGEEFGRFGDGGFLGIGEEDLKPVNLIFEFDNRSREDARIVKAEIAVAWSATDAQPMLQVYRGLEAGGADGRPKFDPTFLIENYGWGPVADGAATMRFVGADGAPVPTPFAYDLGGLETERRIDMTDALAALGADVGMMRAGFACDTPEDYDEAAMKVATAACAARLKATGAFGALADVFRIEFRRIVAPVAGEVEYGWRAQKGRTRRQTARFETTLSLGELDFQVAEMGEGGDPEDLASKAFKFRLDERDYRMRVRLRDTVPAGVTARWRLPFEAEKNSDHEFRMLFELSDGRVISSRPIRLTYLRPRTR